MAKAPLIGTPEPIAALNRVKITEYAHPLEQREPLVDIRLYCPDVVVTDTLCPYFRKTPADLLNRAQASLKNGLKLRVHTVLRTRAMQKRGWDNYFKRMQEEYPQWPLSALRRATNKYYAPYDQPAPPGHCTGGAVDVNLLDKEGNDLDLIAPTQGWEAAYTWSNLISPEAKQSRMTMVNAMLEAGFSNCRDEYWHYSWGDSAWAVRVGEQSCPYGWVYSPIVLEPDFEGIAHNQVALTYTIDPKTGKPLSAEGDFEVSTAQDKWRIGLLWASEVPTILRLHLPSSKSSSPLYWGVNRENWVGAPTIERESKIITLRTTPEADRLYVANFIPPPIEETTK